MLHFLEIVYSIIALYLSRLVHGHRVCIQRVHPFLRLFLLHGVHSARIPDGSPPAFAGARVYPEQFLDREVHLVVSREVTRRVLVDVPLLRVVLGLQLVLEHRLQHLVDNILDRLAPRHLRRQGQKQRTSLVVLLQVEQFLESLEKEHQVLRSLVPHVLAQSPEVLTVL